MSEWKEHWVKASEPRKSVMRIEQAKQRAITGKAFTHVSTHRKIQQDWTREDEIARKGLIASWDYETGLDGLNTLLDDYPFSSGSQKQHLAEARTHA